MLNIRFDNIVFIVRLSDKITHTIRRFFVIGSDPLLVLFQVFIFAEHRKLSAVRADQLCRRIRTVIELHLCRKTKNNDRQKKHDRSR